MRRRSAKFLAELSTQKLFRGVLYLLPLIVAIVASVEPSTYAAQTPLLQEQDNSAGISMIAGTVDVDPGLQAVVRETLDTHRDMILLRSDYYAITDVTVRDGYYFVSVLGLVDIGNHGNWSLTKNGNWTGLLLMKQDQYGSWSGGLRGSKAFSQMLANMPVNVVSEEAKTDLGSYRTDRVLAESYRFPWPEGTAMQFGTLGVHNAGFAYRLGEWKAVDFVSDGDTAAGHAPNKVLAAAAGTVSFKCSAPDGARSAAIQLGDLLYVHLLDRADLTTGRYFEKGGEIGPLVPGSFDEPCGYAQQSPGTYHLHWAFPNSVTFQAGGWTLSLADQVWRKGDEDKGVLSWFTADGSSSPGVTPTPQATVIPSPTATSSPSEPGGCKELLQDGGFELHSDWTLPTSAQPAAYTSSRAKSGNWSAQTGILSSANNIRAYSSVLQTVTIPTVAKAVKLRFWLLRSTTESKALILPANPTGSTDAENDTSGDGQMALILDEQSQVLDLLVKDRVEESDWHYFEYDLSHRSGNTITVYFSTFNNGEDGVTSMYIDNVSLEGCAATEEAPLPQTTPTLTATAAPQPTTASPPPELHNHVFLPGIYTGQ